MLEIVISLAEGNTIPLVLALEGRRGSPQAPRLGSPPKEMTRQRRAASDITPLHPTPVRVTSPPTSGILVLDKPSGPTSHDVVTRVRRALGIREVGHAGTLDPMATGLLIVAVGEATKLVQWLSSQEKSYEATVALGVETDTLDVQGRVVRSVPPCDELRATLSGRCAGLPVAPALRAALDAERARTAQVPPAFSAVKQDGERAYARARRGEQPTLRSRDVLVHRLELLRVSCEPPRITVTLDVSKGYYVRAFARDLSAALGTVGHLTSLRRTRSGCFLNQEAVSVEAPASELLAHVQPLSQAAARVLPVAELTEAGARDARHGRAVKPEDIVASAKGASAWLDRHGDLVAVGNVDESGHGKVLRGFANVQHTGPRASQRSMKDFK
jgi:tRNA pseudouridine55 synthase